MPAFLAPAPLVRPRVLLTRAPPLPPPRRLRPSRRPLAPPALVTPRAAAASSDFHERFDNLRGKPIEPVSATVARFNAAFARPVPIVYRSIINELITTTHLATVCAMWRFDPIFAYGFNQVFDEFLKYYPDERERDALYKACVDSLNLDYQVIRDNAQAVTEWLDGKTEKDVFDALADAPKGAAKDQVGPVVEALAYVRDAGSFDWYYSRMFGIGLIQVMAKVGVDLSINTAESWADNIDMDKSKFGAEMGAYLSSMERLKQAEQIFAESTAREAKKTAERLAERAKAAAKEAEELEKDEQQEKVADGIPPAKDSSPTTSV